MQFPNSRFAWILREIVDNLGLPEISWNSDRPQLMSNVNVHLLNPFFLQNSRKTVKRIWLTHTFYFSQQKSVLRERERYLLKSERRRTVCILCAFKLNRKKRLLTRQILFNWFSDIAASAWGKFRKSNFRDNFSWKRQLKKSQSNTSDNDDAVRDKGKQSTWKEVISIYNQQT